ERCADDLMDMLADCKARSGGIPVVCSSYRTQAKQQSLYDNKVKRLMKQGYSYETALTEAAKVVAVPGTSEHQLGLAVDIVDKSYQILDKKQETTAVQKWLMEHAWEYGFILRYPNGTTDLTGIIYEPWHYRYVGRDAAADIRDKGVTLEEYIEMIRP
ncbi:MAG: M15 family metallopeptidase, partial [Oscillospiraceae bacterium]|nr:M15 family metallopeptidase [Oscillospiraceae bacterium]